MAWQRGVQTAG